MTAKQKPFTAGDWTVDDARAFKAGTPVFPSYRFPFTVLDLTPGGTNLGRIEWCLEPLRGAKERKGMRYIGGLAVWARQTRDPRYQGVVFHLPCYTGSIMSTVKAVSGRDHFMGQVWRMSFCELHDTLILAAYPENHHSVLVVELGSSIGNEVYFE